MPDHMTTTTQQQAALPAELSLIIPSFNEADNVEELIQRVAETLKDYAWEIIYVDDHSPDKTAEKVRKIGQKDPRIRCIHRIGRRGLSSACVEGMLSSSAPYVAVMDADLQHDERILPQMLEILKKDQADIVIGTRYAKGGSVGEWAQSRINISRYATKLSQKVLKVDVSDPMSGFFMMRHQAMRRCVENGVSALGFKILLDLLASSPEPLRVEEVPFVFRTRHAGESKLDTTVAWEYFLLLLDKWIGHIVPVRFITFSLIGGFGALVHLLTLWFGHYLLEHTFFISNIIATLVAMTSNFLLNNLLTYRDVRLHGWSLLKGWISFVLSCSIGAIANVGIANYLFNSEFFWVSAAIAGILVGAVWNYAVTAVYTWKR
ncbi:glycosyltransferase [Magnetococcales bacterium HHB-1]